MKSVMCYYKKRKRKKEGKKMVMRLTGKILGIVHHSLHPQLFKGLKTLVLIGVVTN